MGTSDLKLLSTPSSPFALRVKIALNIKGLDYDNIVETMNPKSDLLLQSNPVYKKIPVLIHGDKSISESAIIVEYIDEVWKNNGTPILPSNAYDRAIARFWVAYIDDKWYNSSKNLLVAQNDESKKACFEQVEEVLLRLEDVLNKYSEGKDFFGGENIGFLDICFGSYLSWLRVTEKVIGKKVLDETKTPALVKWAEAFVAHPAVKGNLPETDKLLVFAKSLVQRMVAAATPK
ncbi:hypothetical protein TSUD_240030 [Trifolium subterraneum]|uniref:glutathione transferase n=1 Tax=Trifolium subterraneum TaxID=3900 RepID=A0A2Z6PF61_TRISU|nr:hypothetical protein TSUD_240030 [Trifolium subterraneum]